MAELTTPDPDHAQDDIREVAALSLEAVGGWLPQG